MRLTLLWMPLVFSLSVLPVAAIPIDYASLAELEATGIGPRIAHRQQGHFTDGRYEDGSVATGGVYAFFPDWFSDVYFNGTLYTYVYGVTEVTCGNCDSDYIFLGEAHMLGGELVGATLGDRWGAINQPYGLDGDRAGIGLEQTAEGVTFGSNEVGWFYIQSLRGPDDMLGRLIATSEIFAGELPRLVYTMSMGAFVPSPVPEPGTFLLLGSGLAGAWMHRRRQKRKGTTT